MADTDLDYTDDAAASWARLMPEVSPDAIQITMRTRRAAALLTELLTEVIVDHGLRALGDYEVLSAMRRSSTPLTPSELAERLLVTRAAITGRLHRLEGAGLIERRTDPADRRSLRLRLTRRGRALTDRVFRASQARQLALLDLLPSRQRSRLEEGMRAFMLALDDRPRSAAEVPGPA
jgi:DNA-binding MarR family transcriptional regulator